jgi:hypothetical protein
MDHGLSKKQEDSKAFIEAFRNSHKKAEDLALVDIQSLILDITRTQNDLRKLIKPVDQLPTKLSKVIRVLPHRERLLFLKLFNFWRSRFSRNIREVNDRLTRQIAQLDTLLGNRRDA